MTLPRDLITEAEFARLVAEKFVIDDAEEVIWSAAKERKIDIWGVPYSAGGLAISPLVEMNASALAAAVWKDGALWEMWSDGQLRPSRWRDRKISRSALDQLPMSSPDWVLKLAKQQFPRKLKQSDAIARKPAGVTWREAIAAHQALPLKYRHAKEDGRPLKVKR